MHTCLQYISMRNEINQPEQETSTKFELFPAFSLFAKWTRFKTQAGTQTPNYSHQAQL